MNIFEKYDFHNMAITNEGKTDIYIKYYEEYDTCDK